MQVISRPLGLPVVRSSAFAFDTAGDYADVLDGRIPGYSYSRIDNPTSAAFAVARCEAPGRDDVNQGTLPTSSPSPRSGHTLTVHLDNPHALHAQQRRRPILLHSARSSCRSCLSR